MKFDLE